MAGSDASRGAAPAGGAKRLGAAGDDATGSPTPPLLPHSSPASGVAEASVTVVGLRGAAEGSAEGVAQEGGGAQDDAPCCWICMAEDGPLITACSCPQKHVHRACLARWQLHSAGTREEVACRFCSAPLPPWRAAFDHLPRAKSAVMSLSVGGGRHVVPVAEGPAGAAAFRAAVQRLYGLGPHDNVDISFAITVPGTGEAILLNGWNAFDAAVFCAALSTRTLEADHPEADHPAPPPPEASSADSGSVYGDGADAFEGPQEHQEEQEEEQRRQRWQEQQQHMGAWRAGASPSGPAPAASAGGSWASRVAAGAMRAAGAAWRRLFVR